MPTHSITIYPTTHSKPPKNTNSLPFHQCSSDNSGPGSIVHIKITDPLLPSRGPVRFDCQNLQRNFDMALSRALFPLMAGLDLDGHWLHDEATSATSVPSHNVCRDTRYAVPVRLTALKRCAGISVHTKARHRWSAVMIIVSLFHVLRISS